MAVDDWFAILYLANHPDADVRAVTVTGAGEAHCGPGVRNALDLMALADNEGAFVTCGTDTPYPGGHVFPLSWRRDMDSLLGLTIHTAITEPVSLQASELLIKMANESKEKLTIVALGPLTNLAEAIETDPTFATKLEMVYIMGGAFRVLGNIHESSPNLANTVSEWNIYADPKAAQIVAASGTPLTWVPLDATNYVPMSREFYENLKANTKTPSTQFVYDTLTKDDEFTRPSGWYFWDPLTAAIALDESIATIEQLKITIDAGDELVDGDTKEAENGILTRVATKANATDFSDLFIKVLNKDNENRQLERGILH